MFQGSVESEWLVGLDVIKESLDENSFFLLVTLYMDSKYDKVGERIETLIYNYLDENIYDFSKLLTLVKTEEDALVLCRLVSGFSKKDIIFFCNIIYHGDNSNKPILVEALGVEVLDINYILDIYEDSKLIVKMGLIDSAGFSKGNDINNWLVKRLFDENEELASNALFSLSKHGSAGFLLIAENLLNLSSRLKVISIEILTFNKVEEVYRYMPMLLQDPIDIITKKVLLSYKNLGVLGVPYIIDSLIIADESIKLDLLKLLKESEADNYLSKILFLLESDDLKWFLVDMIFEGNEEALIEKVLIDGEYNAVSVVMDYAIENQSGLIFSTNALSEFSLYYFLEHYNPDVVYDFFKELGYEKNYIDDYKNVVKIYESIKIMNNVESLNGESEYISSYFEIEQNLSIASLESKAFYEGMENWLESGDLSYLDQSKVIRKAHNPRVLSIEEEKNTFINNLLPEEKNIILDYIDSKKNIKTSFRALTYRLKDFGEALIIQEGFNYIIE